ncbi:hypothetical protein Clacol_009525 [Clathrus columnatus]|uniref:Uncharacterized protein n=1 Tax=Clathrus columnatus TaxID=1419009 RepID=A0AAV5AR94_9AGAM|nr:hypothetical protein Clacol_009525 [Clathrus columnatus]
MLIHVHQLGDTLDVSINCGVANNFSVSQLFYIKLFHKLHSLSPSLLDESIRDDGVQNLANFLESRQSTVHGENVKLLKDDANLLNLSGWTPPLSKDPYTKATQGFHHPQLVRLMCPVSCLVKFDTEPNFHQSLIDGKFVPAHDDWPLFLFDEIAFDPDDLPKTFLRSLLLIQAWRIIFIGPTAANGLTNI